MNGIEGIIEAYRPGKIEEERKIEVIGEDKFAGLLKKYEQILSIEDYLKDNTFFKIVWEKITEILTPGEINCFLQATIKYENEKKYSNYSYDTGLVITRLMYNSYLQRHNNFYLDTVDLLPIDCIGYKVEGTKERQLLVTINGEAGSDLGRESRYLTINVKGNAPGCGYYSKNSIFDIEGDAGDSCGKESKNSIFNIKGNTEGRFGWDSENSIFDIGGDIEYLCGNGSRNSTFVIRGDMVGIAFQWGAKNSTFKTSNQKTLKTLLRAVSGENRIIYIDGTKEIVIRDFHDQ